MLILLLRGSSGTIFPGILDLPTVEHLYPSTRRYKAHRIMVVAEKTPRDIFDYLIDWSQILGEDTILLSQWSVPIGIIASSSSFTASTTTLWLRGGLVNHDYPCLNHITTTDGREFERTFIVPVREL